MDEIIERPRKIPFNVNELMKDIKELDIDLSFQDEEEIGTEIGEDDNNIDNITNSVNGDDVIPIIGKESTSETLTTPLTSTNTNIIRPPRDFSQYNNNMLNNVYDGNNSSDDEEQRTDNDHDDDEEDEEAAGDEQNFNPYVALGDDNEEEEFSDFMDSGSTSIITPSVILNKDTVFVASNQLLSLSDENMTHDIADHTKLKANQTISLQKIEENLFTQDFEKQIESFQLVGDSGNTATTSDSLIVKKTAAVVSPPSIAPLSKGKINLIKSTMLGLKIPPRSISDMAFNNLNLSSIRLGDELN